jgi:hypothetical protein
MLFLSVFLLFQFSFCSDLLQLKNQKKPCFSKLNLKSDNLPLRDRFFLLKIATGIFFMNVVDAANDTFSFFYNGCGSSVKILGGIHRIAFLADINENQHWYKKPFYFFKSIGGGLYNVGSGTGWFLKNGLNLFSIYILYKICKATAPIWKPCMEKIFFKEVPVIDIDGLLLKFNKL